MQDTQDPNQTAQEQAGENAANAVAGQAADAAQLTPEQRIAQLEAELADARDQHLRIRAEMDNLRKRTAEEISTARKHAINKFAHDLLSVKDSLEMALADQSGQFEALKFGVDLTLKQLAAAFDKAHIQEVNPLGAKLDPHLHQAISMEEAEAEANTVIRVMQKGYLLSERVLRPAMVVVAKPKA